MRDGMKNDRCGHSSDPMVGCALEGVANVLAGVRGGAILIHSPQGCASTVASAFDQHEVDFTRRKTACTRLFESDVILGASEKLKDLIRTADKKFETRTIFVVGTCAADIIGEDLEGICRQIQPEIKARLVSIAAGGFRGNLYDGMDSGLELLLTHIPKAETKVPNTVNLIAPFASVNPTWWADLSWVREVLTEFGVEVRCVLAHETRFEELSKAGEASANIVLSHDAGASFARKMEKSHGVPWILSDLPLPVGLENTARWLRALASHFGVAGLADLRIQSGEDRVTSVLRKRALMMIPRYRNARVAVSSDATYAISTLRMLFSELEMIPEVLLLRSGSPHAKALLEKECADLGISPKIVYAADGYAISQALKEIPVDAVLGSAWERYLAEEAGIRIAFDVFSPTNKDLYVDRPYFGHEGMLWLLEAMGNDWEEALRSKEIDWKRYPERNADKLMEGTVAHA
jgi:light-independent protochlorophyllide reductase B subunit